MGHVLLVDDNPELCQSGAAILMADGHTVSTAGSAAEALAFRDDPSRPVSTVLIYLYRSFIGAGIDLARRIAVALPDAAVTTWSGGIRTLPPETPATVRLLPKPRRVSQLRETAHVTADDAIRHPCRSW